MNEKASHTEVLLDLETRHELLLQQLDDLDKKISTTLRQYQATIREEVAVESRVVESPAVEGC